MIATVTLGSCISVQGIFVKKLPNQMIQVMVDGKVVTGHPVGKVPTLN